MGTTNASRNLGTTLGANLRAARKARGWTQHEVAVRLGSGDAMKISRWERGKDRPTDESLFAVADLLEHDVAWFFTEHEHERSAA